MLLRSNSFQANETIPTKFTGQGEDISPSLEWADLPKGTKSLVLLCEDPDAPHRPEGHAFTHWVAYNIPTSVSYLHEDIDKSAEVHEPLRICQGLNSSGKVGYMGPKPPDENTHHYNFYLYAIDVENIAAPGVSDKIIRDEIPKHLLGQAKVTGLFARRDGFQKSLPQ